MGNHFRFIQFAWPALVMLGAACGGDTGEQPLPSGMTAGTGVPATAGTQAAGASAAGTGAGTAAPPVGGAGRAGGLAGMTAPAAGAVAAGSGGTAMAAAGASGATAGAGAGAGGAAGAAPAAGSGGAPPAAMGGFPKTDEVNVKAKGAYAVKTYTEGLEERTYGSSIMYYPEGATPPFAVVAFTPGFTAVKENYTFLGDMLASHGIAALLTSPTSTSDQPPARGDDLVAAVKKIVAENARMGSPLMGKIATDRICVTGHSMGGGGSLFAANELGDMIRCAMPLQPWQPGGSFPMIKVPTMFIGAAGDTIASVSGNAMPHYSSIPNTVEKFLVVFQGDHYLSTNRTSTDTSAPEEATPSFDLQAAYMIPFYKLFLESDERYRPYLYGDMRSMMSVTNYLKSKM
jgi:hypothetical protein